MADSLTCSFRPELTLELCHVFIFNHYSMQIIFLQAALQNTPELYTTMLWLLICLSDQHISRSVWFSSSYHNICSSCSQWCLTCSWWRFKWKLQAGNRTQCFPHGWKPLHYICIVNLLAFISVLTMALNMLIMYLHIYI